MKKETKYVCEVCGKKFDCCDEALKCEKSHDPKEVLRQAALMLRSAKSCKGHSCGPYSCETCPHGDITIKRRESVEAEDLIHRALEMMS